MNNLVLYHLAIRNIKFLSKWAEGRLKKGQYRSELLRKLYLKKYGIHIGKYSYGCFTFPKIPRNSVIGNYCSFGPGVQIFNADHPLQALLCHPIVYNPVFGVVKADKLKRTKITIGNDVWIGSNVIITSKCKLIGDGAIIAAGSIVTKDVESNTIVAGNPARVIRQRHNDESLKMIKDFDIYNQDYSFIKSNLKTIYKCYDD